MDATGEERRKYIQKSGAVKARAKISVIEKELKRRKKVLEAIEFLTGEKTTAQPTVQTPINPQSSNNGQSENNKEKKDEEFFMVIEW